MLPELERINKKPVYEIEIYLQRYGGRIKSKPIFQPLALKPRGPGRPRKLIKPMGFMEYTKLDDPRLINQVRRLFINHIERAKAEGIL